MPAQQRRRRHQERWPGTSREYAAQRRQQDPVSRLGPRTSNLTLKQTQLLAQDEDLDLLGALRAHPEHKQLKHTPQGPVDQRHNDLQRPRHLDR
jgi:hypothetical protein